MYRIIAVSSLVLMAACATSTDASRQPVSADVPPASQSVTPDPFDLAMHTVEELVAAGNEQIAIDRLTQLLGHPDLSDEDAAATLLKRAELRYGDGHDLRGAVRDLDELVAKYMDGEPSGLVGDFAFSAKAEEQRLIAALETGDLSPTETFETLFRLGDHQEAVDLIFSRNLKPDNAYIVDLFQVGYLCEDSDLTGPSFDMTEPDGTERTVRFCEFGK